MLNMIPVLSVRSWQDKAKKERLQYSLMIIYLSSFIFLLHPIF